MADDGPTELSDFLEFGEEVLEQASSLLNLYFRKTISTLKGPFDVVTEADHAVESMFVERLAQAFPDHAMVGEETGRRLPRIDSQYCWVLDPLDGTVNFAVGQPFFAVSLGLLHRGVPLIGWVRDPVHDERFMAIRGQGATLNDIPLSRPFIDQEAVLPVGLSSGFIQWALRTSGAGILSEIIDRFGKTRILGSQALHLCYVATGRLCLAASVEAKLWDDVAGALIVEESGRIYGSLDGGPVFPLGPDSPLWSGRSIRSVAADPVTTCTLLDILQRHDRSRSLAGGIS